MSHVSVNVYKFKGSYVASASVKLAGPARNTPAIRICRVDSTRKICETMKTSLGECAVDLQHGVSLGPRSSDAAEACH